jgi:RimJ/RimL family protein N-acetyltransferase
MSSIDNFSMPEYPTPRSEQFETERLLVRRTAKDDLDILTPTLKNPALAQGLGLDAPSDPQAFINSSVVMWTSGTRWTFTIIETASQRAVGYARIDIRAREGGEGSQAEPTIGIAPDSQGQGYAYETMRGLIGWVFDSIECPPGVTLDEVRAACLLSNSESLGLLKKLAAAGIMKDLGEQQVTSLGSGPGNNQTITAHVFSVTREDYER